VKILLVHNSYQQRGGEDTAFETERDFLLAAGHNVVVYTRTNREIAMNGLGSRAQLAVRSIWASDSYRNLEEIVRQQRPDVAHFHNTFPLISPAAYYVCANAAVPVVQTLHNYRVLCPGGMFFRDGRPCEDCLARSVPWPGVMHSCYRGSHAATGVVATMIATHHLLNTWRDKVTLYVALTKFAQKKFVEGHFAEEQLVVKPNCVSPDPGAKGERGDYALFVGRLAEEKGLRLLLAAWAQLRSSVALRIVGDGPLWQEIGNFLLQRKDVSLMNAVQNRHVPQLMHSARFLVFPSIWYEGFPMVIAEAYACGLPVIAPRFGAMAEILADGVTGLHFEPGSAEDLAAKVEWAWTHSADMEGMGLNARAEFEAKYTAGRNYQMLMQIYERATSA
jgi:glycosyltransferase involved in cell wall biosynthesis